MTDAHSQIFKFVKELLLVLLPYLFQLSALEHFRQLKAWSRCFCWKRAKDSSLSPVNRTVFHAPKLLEIFLFFFFFVESVRIFCGDKCYNLRTPKSHGVGPAVNFTPPASLPSAHRRAKSHFRDYSERLQHLFWTDVDLFFFWRAGVGGCISFTVSSQ